MNKVYLMDCMQGMSGTPDRFYDLAVVDPPYGIGDFQTTGDANNYKIKREKKYKDVMDWNKSIPNDEYFKELLRVSKHQIIWGANYYNCFGTGGALIWDKENESSERYSNCEIASISLQKKVSIFRFRWNGFIQGNMKTKEERIHSCQKPIALYDWIFAKYATKGMKILDTHAGSMSSVISAMKNEMQITAYEIDSDYFNAGKKRIETYLMQGDMFNQPKIEFIS